MFNNFTVAPLPPELDVVRGNKQGIYEIDSELQVTCISRDGRPPSTITWFLDDEPIYDGLGLVTVGESLDSSNTTLFTSSQTLTRRIHSSDDRKYIICRTQHIAGRPQDAKIQLEVRCMK